jgi:hypothetical protein
MRDSSDAAADALAAAEKAVEVAEVTLQGVTSGSGAGGDGNKSLQTQLGDATSAIASADADAKAAALKAKHAERGAFSFTLVPIRPRWRGERRSLRTFPGASLRPGSLAFNTRPRCLSTPLLTPFNSIRARGVRGVGERATKRRRARHRRGGEGGGVLGE